MAVIIKYDRPTSNQLAVDGTLPVDMRNMARINHGLGTVSGTLAFDASYPTGGYSASPAKFGLSAINGVLFSHPGGYVVTYNAATDKVQLFIQGAAAGALTEVANTTNLSALPAVYFEAKGLV